ncbi:hypothetical protein MKW94_017756, partial [Papaver nudicaule]|nr:hypothetical protein [Papaver nudicaule]
MKKLSVWETLRLSYHHGSRKNGLQTSILHGSGFVFGGLVLVLTIVSFMFPSIFATLVTNSTMPQRNHLERYYLRFSSSHWQNSSSNSTTSMPSAENSTRNNQTETYHHTGNSFSNSSVVPDSSTNFSSDSNSSSVKASDQKQGNAGGVDSPGAGECDIFEGEWVMNNDAKQYYPPGSCPYLKNQGSFDCHSNGRPDSEYLKWQWQWKSHPTNAGCINNLP